LRHRAETSWSAGTPLLTCIFLPFSQVLGKGTECDRVRQAADTVCTVQPNRANALA
jgi:hypothetical protein